MILITGATGNLGSSVIDQLLKISSNDQFIATSSNDSGVEKLKQKGVQARLANFNDIDSLNKAFVGVDKLLLISTMEQNRFEQHKNVIDAAKNQGVKHIIYTSLAIKDIQTSAVKDLMFSHFQTEDYIKQSGLDFTILRNTMYADALGQILGSNGDIESIKLPAGEGKVPYVLRRELGEATANLLVQNDHENKIYSFLGSYLVDFKNIAKLLTQSLNREIVYQDITEDEYKSILQSLNFPDFAIYLYAGTINDIKTDQYDLIDDALEKLLGRPTASPEEIIREVFNF